MQVILVKQESFIVQNTFAIVGLKHTSRNGGYTF